MAKRTALTPDEQAELRTTGLVADVLDRWTHPSGSYDLLPLLSFETRRPRIINNAKEATA